MWSNYHYEIFKTYLHTAFSLTKLSVSKTNERKREKNPTAGENAVILKLPTQPLETNRKNRVT